jgi:hypothetical protein
MEKLIAIRKSGNRKTGPVAATYRPVETTCPADCALLNAGCYAQRGFTAYHQSRAESIHDEFEKLKGVDIVRHLVSGDAFIDDKLDVSFVKSLLRFHWLNPSILGWAYTHRCEDWDDAELGPEVHPPNLWVLASVDSQDDARKAWRRGWNTARVTDSLDDKMPEEVICPYDKAKYVGTEPAITCLECRKCWQDKNILFIKLG